MQPDLFTWILAAAICLLMGKEIGKWLPSMPSFKSLRGSAQDRRQAAAEKLATGLKSAGLQLVQDVRDSLDRVEQVAAVAKDCNDSILKELSVTYERVMSKAPSQRAKTPVPPAAPGIGDVTTPQQ